MSSPDSPTIDFFNQRLKRKLEDYEDDDELTYLRTRYDYRNPNSPPAIVSSNSFTDQIVHDHRYLQPRASTSNSSEDPQSSSYHDRLQYFVRLISEGKTLVLHGKPEDKVKAIHEKIQAVTGIPMKVQRLIYQGRQLQWEHTLADCMITNDASLHLVGRMRSTEHPQAWQRIDALVSMIYRLCKGDTKVCLNMVRAGFSEFLNMKTKEDIQQDVLQEHFASHLKIFQSLCAPKALVLLYISPHQGNKVFGHELIRNFIDSIRKKLPTPLYLLCAPVLLELCKLLSRAVSQDDPLYNYSRSSLGSMLVGLRIGKNHYNNTLNRNSVFSVEDIFPFVSELANKLSESLNSDNFGPSTRDVCDFVKFLRPIKTAIKEIPNFDGLIPVPTTYTLPCYDLEIKTLYLILLELLVKVVKFLVKSEADLATEEKKDTRYDQFLVLLKELRGISKLFQGAEEIFWTGMKQFKVSLCYLIVKYTKKGENCNWIRKHKEVLDFESRRHLAMMLLPEINEGFDDLHEMLIDRSNLLAESFEYIASQEPEDLRAGLFMAFKNEEATGPGVLREWFFLVCQEIFNPQNALFLACPIDRRRFFPNPASKVDPMHLKYFKFAGRVIALALMHKVQVGISLDPAFFTQLAGDNICLEDIKDADPYLYNSCKQILNMDPVTVDEDVLGLTFVHEIEELGSIKVVELFTNGKNIVVNSRNRKEYVDLLINHRFVTAVTKQVAGFGQGFTDIIGKEESMRLFFKSLELEDLDGMLHGSEDNISVQDWKLHTEYNGFKETDLQIYWFWQIVEEMTAQQRMVLLFFWTSLKHLPVEGFKGLASKLYIYKSNDSVDLLPCSHTCFYRICFPAYPSMAVMQKRLNLITQEHVACSFGTW